MKSITYLKKTFVLVFIFLIIERVLCQLFEDYNLINLNFLIKTLVVSSFTAIILETLNYFLKIDLLKGQIKYINKIKTTYKHKT